METVTITIYRNKQTGIIDYVTLPDGIRMSAEEKVIFTSPADVESSPEAGTTSVPGLFDAPEVMISHQEVFFARDAFTARDAWLNALRSRAAQNRTEAS